MGQHGREDRIEEREDALGLRRSFALKNKVNLNGSPSKDPRTGRLPGDADRLEE
jgi:hypothetical protein